MNRKIFWLCVLILMAACTGAPDRAGDADGKLSVVATTTIVGDVVSNVAGERVDLSILVPPGADPHRFDPSPAQARALADADLIFINGLGLDRFALDLIIENQLETVVVSVSDSVPVIELSAADEEAGEDEAGHEDEDGHAHEGEDPHVWMDPNNVIIWVENIAAALAEADPEYAADYDANAAAYIHSLIELDTWIRSEVEQIPPAERLLVTDHDALGYFAATYNFTVVGFVVPGFSTLSQPSAQEMAGLIDEIRAQKVPVIFVDPSFNPALAESVAADAGVALATLYTGSLSPADGPAGTYLDLMRTNVRAIVAGLK